MKKILYSAASIVFIGVLAYSATGAFFSDTETSTGNTFASGAIDLTIDSVAHYNGMVCTEVGDTYHWIPEANVTLDQNNQPVVAEIMNEQTEWDAFNTANPAQYPQAGTTCTGTWPLANLGGDDEGFVLGKFFDFLDIKPGDQGENTVSIHIDSNDAWMCVDLANVDGADLDATKTEPEVAAGDTTFADDLAASELDENLHFFAWLDDGDNVFEAQETALGQATASELQNQKWALADSTTGNGPIQGDVTHYIGLYWCAGDITVNGNDLSCDGAAMGNIAQTDSWLADLNFYVEQSRNNADFRCNPQTAPVTTLTLAKAVLPPQVALDTDFTLAASGPTNISGIEGNASVTNAVVTPGVYSLSESGGPGGTTSIVWECTGNATAETDNGNGTATVTVGVGENVVCGVTNNYPAPAPAITE